MRLAQRTVEIFCNGNCIASHIRLTGRPGQYSTVVAHMPESHREYLQWNGERFLSWVEQVCARQVDSHLGVDHTPVLPPAGPLFRDVHHGQVQHFQQAVVGGEHGFGFGHLAQLAVETLNGVGSVNQPPHLLRVLEIGAQVCPVVPLGLGDFRIFSVPVFSESIQGIQCRLLVYGSINCLQISHERLQVLVGHILAGIAQLVDNAVLDLGLGKSGMDGRIKSGKVIRAGDENILHTTVPQAVKHGHPELGALIFAYTHAQYILPAIQINTYGNIDRLPGDLPLAADMVVDGIHKYHRIDGLQRPLLPLFGHRQDLVRDPADRAVRDRNSVDILNMCKQPLSEDSRAAFPGQSRPY